MRADVRVRDGRIVEVGARPAARRRAEIFDAGGAVVTPGFIDTHAHTDPQVFWDPTARPRSAARRHDDARRQLQPVAVSRVDRATRGDISDLFAYIEDVPRHLFDDSVPWTWTDYAGYRDTVNATRRRHRTSPRSSATARSASP